MIRATQDQNAFRSTLLLAALHYSWNSGDEKRYESVFLSHKGESIRETNKLLAKFDTKSLPVSVVQICTLCLIEVRTLRSPLSPFTDVTYYQGWFREYLRRRYTSQWACILHRRPGGS
jgi:hypothetical protein